MRIPPGFIRSVKHNKPHGMTRQGQKSSFLWEVPGDLPIRVILSTSLPATSFLQSALNDLEQYSDRRLHSATPLPVPPCRPNRNRFRHPGPLKKSRRSRAQQRPGAAPPQFPQPARTSEKQHRRRLKLSRPYVSARVYEPYYLSTIGNNPKFLRFFDLSKPSENSRFRPRISGHL